MKYEKVKPDVREKALEHGFSFLFDEELVMLILLLYLARLRIIRLMLLAAMGLTEL